MALACAVGVACASAACDETIGITPLPGANDGDGGDGSTAEAGPPPATPAPFGLDTRPANTTCLAPARPVPSTGVKFVDAFPALDFNQPMKLMMAPGDANRFYVAERGTANGAANVATKVRTFPIGATSNAQVTDFATVMVYPIGEGGFLGMAFHPQWQTNHTFFTSVTRKYDGRIDPDPAPEPNSDLTSVIAKWTSSDDGVTVGNPVEILTRVQPYSNHDGGNIAFGPDGFLYFGLGDGGSGDDPLGSGQNLSSWLGKMLRIDVDNGSPYGIPPTNPFANSTGTEKKEIYAYGLRNPFRWNFDRGTGDLWVGDVGQNTWEEIDKVELGGNYGWKLCEGFHKRGSTTELCDAPGVKDPVVEHPRSEANSITGGVVYRGKAMPDLVGTYIYADFAQGNVFAIVYDGTGKAGTKILAKLNNIVDFGQDADGEIYPVSIGGTIYKMVPDAAPSTSAFPDTLAKTGCFDPTDIKKPAAGLVPYSVRSPLWSDGAEKERWIALPEGKTVSVSADGDFQFPKGTVLVKNFSMLGKRVETRLFVLHDDGEWAGYSYEWNDAQTDATLLPAGKVRDLGGGTSWTYPSRSQCLQCHTAAAGGSLGLEVGQLNGDAVYPSTNRLSNQLATLEHIGVFAAPLGDPATLTKYAEPAGTEPVEARARSYMQSNCSHCHRPGGGGGGNVNLLASRSLKDTAVCNGVPQDGTFGIADAKVVAPGAPAKSILSLRVHATDAKRMPPVGVHVTDAVGTKLLDDWITSLTTCP